MKNVFKCVRISKHRLITILLAVAYLTLTVVITIQVSYSSYASRLASSETSVRVASWSVNVTPTDNAVVYVSSSSNTVTNWSNAYKVDIINNSEVLACYGRSTGSVSDTYHSTLAFDNFPAGTIEKVRLVSAKTGETVLESSDVQNNGITFILDGTLNPGETITYYVQFAANSTSTYSYSEVTVDADFTFEQAFETTTASVAVN